MTDRTVFIGLDGATFSILNPLMEAGVMPFLKQLIASGASGILPSVVPPLTPPAWTSIMTGRSPGSHGIFDFFRFESTNSKYLRLNTSRDINCETIWSIASRYGLRVTSLYFPVMAPPRPISGYMIPGFVTWHNIRLGCYPPGLYETLENLPFFSAKELAIEIDVELEALTGCPEEEWEEWIKLHIRREEQRFQILRHLMIRQPCHLTGIVFDGVDKLQHLFWRFIHPDHVPKEPSPQEQKIRDLCLKYFSQLDRFIADIAAVAGPGARIFMASDHGFSTSVETFHINTWLRQNGYLEWSESSGQRRKDGKSIGAVILYFERFDWSKTTAYSVAPSSRGFYISVKGERGEDGISPEDYEGYRRELIDKLLQLKHPLTDEPVVTNVWTREEAYSGSRMNLAPDVTLALNDGGFSTLKSDTVLKKRSEVIGVHHPEGIFIAAGPGIRKGISIEGVSILDITPVLLYSLGIPIPEDLEGCVPKELLDPDFVQDHPIKTGQPTITPEEFPMASRLEESEEDKAKVLKRLKVLGYIE